MPKLGLELVRIAAPAVSPEKNPEKPTFEVVLAFGFVSLVHEGFVESSRFADANVFAQVNRNFVALR
ncbi:hypothetical protein AYO40_00360 [Planctomycetaceae bacterium SCGC AG-212-D15]|nr:hypothetical protein AYO40_00360 [Planctomycetaceae bacterium SCGC AG-212-D15]